MGATLLIFKHAPPTIIRVFCTWGSIHLGWVDPPSQLELTTSRRAALQAQRPSASSLEIFAQSFLHRVKIHGLERGSTYSGGLQFACARSLISSPSGCLSAWLNKRSLLSHIQDGGGAAVPQLVPNLCASRVECGECCYCRRPPASFHWLLELQRIGLGWQKYEFTLFFKQANVDNIDLSPNEKHPFNPPLKPV